MSTTFFEKLQLKDETDLLIQGLPYSIERQFNKFNYSKSVTPLLRIKKVDFAILFAITKAQLKKIVPEVIEVLKDNAKFWIAYPKPTSKIVSDLNMKNSWSLFDNTGFEMVQKLNIDHVWDAVRFSKIIPRNYSVLDPKYLNKELNQYIQINYEKDFVEVPEDLAECFTEHVSAYEFYNSLTIENRKDFVLWIETAEDTSMRNKRIMATIDMLLDGTYSPYLAYQP